MSLLSLAPSIPPIVERQTYGLTPEQLEIRRTRVGASEIAALIPPAADGTVVDHYGRGPFDIFTAKMVGGKPPTAAMRWGSLVEGAGLTMHCESAGLTMLPNPGTLVHPRFPWLCATPDAIAVDASGRRRLVEFKNAGQFMAHLWGPEGTGDVPMTFAAQVQVTLSTAIELGMVDDNEADLAACIGGMPPAPYVLDYRPHLVEQLAELARVFVEKHLKTGEPPAQGWDSDAAERWLRAKYPSSANPLLEATAADLKLARQIGYSKKRIKKWESVEAEGKNRLRKRIGPAEGIAGVATNKCRKDGTRVLLLAKDRSNP